MVRKERKEGREAGRRRSREPQAAQRGGRLPEGRTKDAEQRRERCR